MYSQKYKRKKPPFRAWLDYFMALAMMFFGFFIIFSQKMTGADYFSESRFVHGGMKWIIGILFMLYGIFRGYRGWLGSREKEGDEE